MTSDQVTVGDLVSILKNIDVVDTFRPDCGGPTNIRIALASLTDENLGKLFYAIDQIAMSARVLKQAVVHIKRD